MQDPMSVWGVRSHASARACGLQAAVSHVLGVSPSRLITAVAFLSLSASWQCPECIWATKAELSGQPWCNVSRCEPTSPVAEGPHLL